MFTSPWRPLVLAACLFACSSGRLGEPPDGDGRGVETPGDGDTSGGPDASPAGEVPDAGPGCVDEVINLLANPSFDEGPVVWLEQSDFELIVVRDELFIEPQSPDYALWLGGVDEPTTDVVSQEIAVPVDATGFVIRGHRHITGIDPFTDQDTLRFELRNQEGALLELLADPNVPCNNCTYSNTSGVTNAFTPFSLTPAPTYAGQTIVLRIEGRLPDFGTITDFLVDTLAAEVTVCR